MESTTTRYIKSGRQYDHLIPQPGFTESTIKRGATVADTVKFIPDAVRSTAWQTEKLTNVLFRGYDLFETCKRIWQFLYDHIPYEPDEKGREQIKSPRLSWHMRHQRGIDCDCYTTFISTILYNLRIPYLLRIARYKEDHFQHIYPVVPLPGGKYIVIDCVVNRFNYEEPYTEIKDTKMNLEFLDGIPQDTEILGIDEIEGLEGKTKVGKAIQKGVHVFNRVEPATIALRNGLLAAMKLNTMNIAGRLKWSYMTEQQAKAKGVNLSRFHKLRLVRERLEKIFYSAGGKEKNLKRAILSGKGNKGATVQGLGYIDPLDLQGLNENTPLRELLGLELWHSENMNGPDDLDGLGELGAAVAVATTTAALATVAELLNKIGSIFPAQQPGSNKGSSAGAGNNNSHADPANISLPAATPASAPIDDQETVSDDPAAEEAPTQEEPANEESEELSGIDKIAEVWKKQKHWAKPTLLSLCGLSLLYAGYRVFTPPGTKPEKSSPPPAQPQFSGSPPKKKPKGRKKVQLLQLM